MNTSVSKRSVIRQVLRVFKPKKLLWSDAYTKKLYMWNTALIYLAGILQERRSVASMAQHVESTPWMQKLVNLKSIDPSALNRRLANVPTDELRQTYLSLVGQYAKAYKLPRPVKRLGALAAVDATTLTLGKVRGEWAYQQTGCNAVKMHTCLDLTGEWSAVPSRVVLSTATVADLDPEVTGRLLKEKQVTYLLDRGYLDYRQYIGWARQNILFVARIKANSKVSVLENRPVSDAFVKQDADVEVSHPQIEESVRLRLVVYTYTDSKGEMHHVRVLTNRWDVCAADVALMYGYRWKVELFFKFMKQRLGLKKIFNAKPQAVWNQIYLHLIAYLLLEIRRENTAPTFKRGEWLSKLNAYMERPWLDLLEALRKPKQKTSRGRRKKGGRPRKHPKRLKPQRIVIF